MAKIEIQKKKPIWPWVLLIILVILAICYFFVFDDNEVNDDDMNQPQTEQLDGETTLETRELELNGGQETINLASDDLAYTGAGVSGYIAYIGDRAKMGVDHEYTNRALFYLIDAVRETAENMHIDISDEMEAVREEAKYITQNWKATDHAGHIKNAGTKIVEVLQTIQLKSFPNLAKEMRSLKMAVQEINPDVLTLNQKENVLSFFDRAADVLQKMNQ